MRDCIRLQGSHGLLKCGQKNAPSKSGRQRCSAAVSFSVGPQRLLFQMKQISETVLLQSNRSARLPKTSPPWITVVEMADVRFLRVCHDSAILGGVSGKFLLLAPSRSQSCRCEPSPAPKKRFAQRGFEVSRSFPYRPSSIEPFVNGRWVSPRDS